MSSTTLSHLIFASPSQPRYTSLSFAFAVNFLFGTFRYMLLNLVIIARESVSAKSPVCPFV